MESIQDQGAGLTYREELPLAIEPQAESGGKHHWIQLNAGNEMLLRACLAIYDHREPEEHDEVMQELTRLDLKLNLLLNVVQQLAVAQSPQPQPVPVTLTAEGVSWPERFGPCLVSAGAGTQQLAGEALVRVNIYISPLVALPLSFDGYFDKVEIEGGSAEWQCKFASASPVVSELLEKLIFSFHRREVAQERAAG